MSTSVEGWVYMGDEVDLADALAIAEAKIMAGLQLAARLEAEAQYADRRVDVGVVAHRIRVALGMTAEHGLPDPTDQSRAHL